MNHIQKNKYNKYFNNVGKMIRQFIKHQSMKKLYVSTVYGNNIYNANKSKYLNYTNKRTVLLTKCVFLFVRKIFILLLKQLSACVFQ